MTLQCGQNALFSLHCSSIHPRQHAKLEQVVFICQLLKSLLHRTADIATALEAALLLFRITCTMISIFCKLPLVTGNTLRAKVAILLLFLCAGNNKSLSGELIVSKYVAESITMIAGRFGHEGLCQLRTEHQFARYQQSSNEPLRYQQEPCLLSINKGESLFFPNMG